MYPFSGRNEIEKGEAKKDLCTRLQISLGLHKFRDFSTILLPAVKHFPSRLHLAGRKRERFIKVIYLKVHLEDLNRQPQPSREILECYP